MNEVKVNDEWLCKMVHLILRSNYEKEKLAYVTNTNILEILI